MLNFWNLISSFSFNNNTLNYYTPDSVNYFYGFGSLSGVFLLLQIFTGIVLAFHYVSDTLYAFDSVSRFTREVPYGWLFSNMHQTGTTFLFVFLYLHMASGIFFNSYNWPNMLLWCTGVLIFFLVVVTAFLGYVLPWSQLGFWAATVITNMLTSIPLIGGKLVIWIWGGFSVQNNTLNKFAALHFCIPFLILGIIFLHLVCLHEAGSSNMLSHGGAISETEFLDFFSYFINKDLVIFSLVW